ncbi:MAG: hypothetical protein QOH98_984 [Methylobacteriaceae bacterium]|nr:hypothetical protein [Methylobacteriaceae bacterium]
MWALLSQLGVMLQFTVIHSEDQGLRPWWRKH